MVYLNKEQFSRMIPGTPIGDAKSLETRGVSIYVDSNGFPTNGLRTGSVVYLDSGGYAVPFTDPETDFRDKSPFPYGVVWTIDANTDPNVRDITPRENQAVVVVDGVVPIVCQKNQSEPKKGDLVNPYGGVVTDDKLPVLGICDGTGTGTDSEGKSVTLVAVRVNTRTGGGSNPTPVGNLDIPSKVVSGSQNSPAIQKNSWVVLDTIQPLPGDKDQRPRVLAADTNTGNKHIYGIAVNEPEGDSVTVRVYGTAYVPYVYRDSPKLEALKAANGGALPSTFSNRITYTNGRVGWIFTAILTAVTAIGAAIDLGERVYRMIRGKSSPAKCVDNVPKKTAKFHALLSAEGGKFDVEPDGYLGVFVNTGLVAQSTLTEAPVLLDPPELDANGNQLIVEGRIYAGSLEGVTKITPQNHTGVSFFGVSAPYDIDDEEVNPPTKNGVQRIRIIREGTANVLANGVWKQGDYINYLGKAIPADEEEFVPHIGKALEAAKDGELGSVDIRAFNPNAYIVVDHVSSSEGMSGLLNTSVWVEDISVYGQGNLLPKREVRGNAGRHPHPGPLKGVVGVLTRYDANFYSDSKDYNGRAIIQVGGYVKCKYNWQIAYSHKSGIAPGGFVNYLDAGRIEPGYMPITKDDKYMDILGQLVIMNLPQPGEMLSDGWVLLNPHTVYIGDGF